MDLEDRTNQIIVLLNMGDVAEREGINVDVKRLSEDLGLPVIPLVAVDKASVAGALKKIEQTVGSLPAHDTHVQRSEVIDSVKRFSQIDSICDRSVSREKDENESFTNKVDNIVMNRFAAIPIFLAAMFITFWFVIGLGSAFIDFFDIIGGLVFVDIPGTFLEKAGSPATLPFCIRNNPTFFFSLRLLLSL